MDVEIYMFLFLLFLTVISAILLSVGYDIGRIRRNLEERGK